MKSFSFVIAIGLVAFAATLANAQQKTNVCIIDLAQVFRSHPTFNQQLTQLQKEAEAFKTQMNEQRTALIARNDRLMAMQNKESAEFKQEESSLAQLAAKLDVDARNKIKDFAKREAELHFVTYQQIQGLIAQYCNDRGIRIVMAYQKNDVDQKNADSIMRWVNQSVVYNAPQKDITQPIIQYLAQVTRNNQTQNK